MTREERIVSELNKEEQRAKRLLEADNMDKLCEQESRISGLLDMLLWLGYRPVEDTEKCENIKGFWINAYKAIEDVR